jgi:2-dehydropantoate 2-reductase
MRIAIFGSGGVGGYFGGKLAHAGEDVTFIARGDHLRALRRDGLNVESVDGDFIVKPVQAQDDPKQVGQVDAVILGVKAWQVPEAAEAMRPLVGQETMVLPLQNGVEAADQLAAALGADRVLSGLCYLVTFLAGPGRIRHAGMKPRVIFGELDNQLTARVESLRDSLARAGIQAEIPPNIQSAVWSKFLFISSLSGVGATTRAPIGVLRSIPETRQMLHQAMEEVLKVASAREVLLDKDIIASTMRLYDGLPADATASMQRDIMEGRPSELDSQTGAMVRLGSEAGVATPLNAFMYAALLPQELRSRGRISYG